MDNMKHILVDIYKTKQLYTGLGQFEANFAAEAEKNSTGNLDISYLIPAKNEGQMNFPNQVKSSLSRKLFPQLNKTYDLWHSLQQFPSHFPNNKTKFMLTVHDLNFMVDKSEEKAARYLNKLQRNIDRADVVTAISNFSKTQLQEHIDLKGKPVHVIHNGVKLNKYVGCSKPDYITRPKFFFTIGVFKKTKNFEALIPLMKYFPDHQLVIAGNSDTKYGQEIKQQIQELNLSENIVLAGEVSDAQKYWLYSNCDAFLFPSMAEGFGLPVIEAMSCGKAVFLSKSSSLPEIGKNYASYFPDFNPENMATVIKKSLIDYSNNEAQLAGMMEQYAARFNWNNCFNEYLKIYELVLGSRFYEQLAPNVLKIPQLVYNV
jgi:Glycosyltransferase